MHISPWARTRVFIRQLNLSSRMTRTRLPFHSWPAQMIQHPRQRAFSTLKEPQQTSSITRDLMLPHSTKTEWKCRASTATASEAMPPSYSTVSPARSHPGTGRQVEISIADLEDD